MSKPLAWEGHSSNCVKRIVLFIPNDHTLRALAFHLLSDMQLTFSSTLLQNLVLLFLWPQNYFLQRRRGSRAEPVSEDDILRSIGKLKSLGSGFQVVKIGSQKLVRSVPGELNTDKSALLAMAQQTGYVSETHIKEVTSLSSFLLTPGRRRG